VGDGFSYLESYTLTNPIPQALPSLFHLALCLLSPVMKNEEPLNVEDIPSTLTESSQQRTLLDKNDDIEPAQEVEHADQSEDSPIDIIRSTIHTVDNPKLPVFTYVRFHLLQLQSILTLTSTGPSSIM
jgi:hypothetical protein